MEKRKKNQDRTEDIIYGINSDQQSKINAILRFLGIEPRKRQNINFIKMTLGNHTVKEIIPLPYPMSKEEVKEWCEENKLILKKKLRRIIKESESNTTE